MKFSSVRSIQNKIASWLAFKLNEEEPGERAKCLSMRLSNDNEKILIILDDVWGKVDFDAIGIPFGENHKGCKVLNYSIFINLQLDGLHNRLLFDIHAIQSY